MDIENMMAFVTVAELRSITAAAASMNHLQSNMTAKIKKIESHYEQQLFIRSARGMELTSEGDKLYKQFKKMILLWEETEQEMQRRELKLRIGTMRSVLGRGLTEAFTNLYAKYPDAAVTLITGATEHIENQLIQGHIDLAFTIGKFGRPQLQYRSIGTEELVLIRKRSASNASLAQYLQEAAQLTISDDCIYASILEQVCADHNIKQGPRTIVGVLETMLHLASLGMGVALTSKSTARQFGVADYMELPAEYRYVEKYLVTRHNYELSPMEKQFVEVSRFM
ncbi:LysR family transcriptional regulator [Paenibacillus kobensis]|uniref:LysR family transcriptional regulator n=1 Tax=Paenibacillus kobensis TaxID=59841 RepID=UPI000FD8157B|nr:LysR family transcriptional regulator [Paenibacillus kobensis]